MYVVALKCYRNNFNSEKYKTVQSLKLHFLQSSHIVQLLAHTSASDHKGVGNIPAIL